MMSLFLIVVCIMCGNLVTASLLYWRWSLQVLASHSGILDKVISIESWDPLDPFLCSGTSELFPASAIMNKAVLGIMEHVSLRYTGTSFGYMSRSGIVQFSGLFPVF